MQDDVNAELGEAWQVTLCCDILVVGPSTEPSVTWNLHLKGHFFMDSGMKGRCSSSREVTVQHNSCESLTSNDFNAKQSKCGNGAKVDNGLVAMVL